MPKYPTTLHLGYLEEKHDRMGYALTRLDNIRETPNYELANVHAREELQRVKDLAFAILSETERQLQQLDR